jgi:ASC-1-like (ASCH) protein
MSNERALALPDRISKIGHAISVATTPDQLKQVIALADAAIAYAKSLGKEFADGVKKASALKFDAEERLGQMLAAMPKATGTKSQLAGRDSSGGTKSEPPEEKALTLAELGIDKKTSARVQAIAALPPETKEAIKAGETTVAKVLAKPKADRPEPEDKLRARIAELEAEVEDLREHNEILKRQAVEVQADNESMARVFESDEKLVTALAEAKRYREMNRLLEERVRGMQGEMNAAIRSAKGYKAKLDKMERAAA